MEVQSQLHSAGPARSSSAGRTHFRPWITAVRTPRNSEGLALKGARSQGPCQSERKKGNFIEWTLSCAEGDVWGTAGGRTV